MANPLSRVSMQNIIRNKDPKINLSIENKKTNLYDKENDIILDIIKGSRDVAEDQVKNNVITLEEAANRIKNNR